MKTIKPGDILHDWHLIDAKNKVLGRISTEIATFLMGKNKSYYTPNLDTGDFVVVVNAKDIALTGKKTTQKKYYHHSGYPGGLYSKTAGGLKKEKPELLIRKSVTGMLPKTTMGKIMAKKLFVFANNEHPYNDKFKNPGE